MAKEYKTETIFTDDLDGKPAAETVNFSLDGTNYEIDLSKANASALRKALKAYVDAAREVKATRKTRGRKGPNPADVRAWAAENGIEVSARGRVPAEVIEAYNNAA